MTTILMLGGAKRVSLGRHLLDAFAAMGVQARIVSYELDRRVPIAAIGEVTEGLRWTDPRIDGHLLALMKRCNVSLLLPFVDPAVEICARLKKECPGVFVPVSDEKVCRTMFDKRLSFNYFSAAGIPQPPEALHSFPRIYKPRLGSASKGILIARNEREVPQDIDTEQYLVQQYITDAEEYTVDCYIRTDGEILSIVPRQRLETAAGEAMRSVTVGDANLISLSRRVLASAPFRGPVTLQFLKSPDTGYLLMEVNPRAGGGIVTSIGAGSRMPQMLAAETLGFIPEPVNDWIPGTLMTRYTQEVIFRPCR